MIQPKLHDREPSQVSLDPSDMEAVLGLHYKRKEQKKSGQKKSGQLAVFQLRPMLIGYARI